MLGLESFLLGQISDRASDFQDLRVGPGRERQLLQSGLEQFERLGGHLAVRFKITSTELSILASLASLATVGLCLKDARPNLR